MFTPEQNRLSRSAEGESSCDADISSPPPASISPSAPKVNSGLQIWTEHFCCEGNTSANCCTVNANQQTESGPSGYFTPEFAATQQDQVEQQDMDLATTDDSNSQAVTFFYMPVTEPISAEPFNPPINNFQQRASDSSQSWTFNMPQAEPISTQNFTSTTTNNEVITVYQPRFEPVTPDYIPVNAGPYSPITPVENEAEPHYPVIYYQLNWPVANENKEPVGNINKKIQFPLKRLYTPLDFLESGEPLGKKSRPESASNEEKCSTSGSHDAHKPYSPTDEVEQLHSPAELFEPYSPTGSGSSVEYSPTSGTGAANYTPSPILRADKEQILNGGFIGQEPSDDISPAHKSLNSSEVQSPERRASLDKSLASNLKDFFQPSYISTPVKNEMSYNVFD